MQIYDIIIILILVCFAIKGLKDGFLKTLVGFVGFIIITILAYNLKDIVGNILVLNLPLFKFYTLPWSSSILSIIMYQGIAFVLMLLIFAIIYQIILGITGIIEKILKLTIVLAIPSKILGLIIGLLEGYILIYLVLFFLAQPFIPIDIQANSNFASPILEKTPLLSHFGEKGIMVFNEIRELSDIEEQNELDLRMTEIVLKENVISPDTFQKLVDKGKIKIDGVQEIIDQYK